MGTILVTTDEIHSATISSVVEQMGLSQIQPDGEGAMYALCPFHAEQTPSFHVDFSKGVWHCFGCQAGGRVHQLLQRLLKINGLQALVLENFLTPKSGPIQAARKVLRSLPEVSLAQYPKRLLSSKYLWRRNIRRRETLQAFDVRLDPVYKRIIIPIRHVDDTLVGFVGRRLIEAKEEGPKYIHTVSAKSLTLFNLNRVVKAQCKTAVLTEGPFDVLRCYDAGFPYCVATLGGGLTQSQADLLALHVTRVVLAFDNDKRGPLYTDISDVRLSEIGVRTRRLTLPAHRKDLGECTNTEITLLLKGGYDRGQKEGQEGKAAHVKRRHSR